MDFPNFFFIFLVKNSRFANMKKLFHFMHLEILTEVPTLGSEFNVYIKKSIKIPESTDIGDQTDLTESLQANAI